MNERDADAVLRERLARGGDALLLARDVETAFRRELLASFRDQAAVGRPVLDGKLDHRVRHGHLEIHARLHGTQQHVDVARLDVAPIFAQDAP